MEARAGNTEGGGRLKLDDCILVMLECIPYEGLMQRHQHLARELAKYLSVIYVEETPSRMRRLLDGRPLDPALNAHKLGLRDVVENLKLFKAPPYTPRSTGYRRSIERSARSTAQSLKPLLPKDRHIILWLFSPAGLGSIGLYDEALTIFDCFDAFGEFPGEARFRSSIIDAMNETAEKSDLVITTNDELRDKLLKYNENTAIVQNGCDPEHFATGGRTPEREIIDMNSLPRPVIGYMGDIAPWLDLESIIAVAKRHPEWSIVMLGTWKRDKSPVEDMPNIHAPGRIDYEELPHYARGFDVGTIPFELTDLTRVVNPLKLYEYFAMGIPVVASPIPEVARHEDFVYLASGPDEFVSLAEVAVREPDDAPVRSRRRELARQNSWESRGQRIKDLLEQNLGGNG